MQLIDGITMQDMPVELIADTRDLSRDQWLELRRQGIGGSDAAALLGMSKYASPITVWMEKTFRHVADVDNQFTKWGKLLEPPIRAAFPEYWQETIGSEIKVAEYPYMVRSIDYPFMQANVDGVCKLGIKTATVMQASEWKDDSIPDAYYCQVQHYMSVFGWQWIVVPVLIGKSLTHRFVPRNGEFIDELIEIERAFWEDHVDADVMPAPFGIDAEGAYLDALGAAIGNEELHIEGLADLVTLYEEAKEDEKAAAEEKKRMYHEIKRRMIMAGAEENGDTSKVVAIDGDARATWTFFETKRFDASKYKQDHPKQYARYSKKSTQSRLTVKTKKEIA